MNSVSCERNNLPGWRNWYTRTTQNRVPKGVRVRFSPRALDRKLCYTNSGVALEKNIGSNHILIFGEENFNHKHKNLKLLTEKYMDINQRGFANIILVVMIVVILVCAVGYFAFTKKSELVAQQSPTPTPTQTQRPVSPTPDKNVNWKTYTDSNLSYSFQYPPPTCELQRFTGDTSFAICYLPKGSDGGLKHNNGYVISLGFISQSQLEVMSIAYCDPNDSSRCESLKIGKVTASIDWGTGTDASASAWISHPSGGVVTFNLQPATAESKKILKQILSTFKFTN